MRIYRRHNIKKTLIFIVMVSIIIAMDWSNCISVSATSSSSIKNQINDATKKKEETKNNLNDTKNKISNLESSKTKLEDYLTDLNAQMTAICEKLEEIEGKITEKEAEITITQENLEQAKIDEAKQYEDMKKRIQFMYENGNTDYIKLVLEAENFSEALGKFEYISKIYEYDREMLEKYNQLKNDIAQKEQQLEKEQNELLALQEEQVEQQNQVAVLVADTSTKISSYSSQIASAEAKAAAYEEQIKKQESTIESLNKEKAKLEAEEKKKAEEAKKKAAEKKKQEEKNNAANNTTNTTNTTTSGDKESNTDSGNPTDVAMLAALIHCEAVGESYEGKLAVGTVVMNRVASSMYPNTLVGVIYQSSQFSPVASGRFSIVLGQGPSSDCVAAAQQVMGGHRSGSWLHFKTVRPELDGTIIGNHVFY